MKIDLEVEEEVEITVEQACEYIVWGERNEEGTMVIKWRNKNANPSQDAPEKKGCGKYLGYKDSETGQKRYCGDEVFGGEKAGLRIILCEDCRKKSKSVEDFNPIEEELHHAREHKEAFSEDVVGLILYPKGECSFFAIKPDGDFAVDNIDLKKFIKSKSETNHIESESKVVQDAMPKGDVSLDNSGSPDKSKESQIADELNKDYPKTFDNIKELNEYLRNEAKEGERVCLDEEATFTHPRRKKYFVKPKRRERNEVL